MTHRRRDFLKSALFAPAPSLLGATDRATDPAAVIRKVEAIPARVTYRSTFVIGRGLVAAGGQTGQYVYVRVEAADGRVGWGETIALPSWSYETVESIVSTVEKHLAPIVIGRSAFDQAYFLKQFDEVLTPAVSQGFPFAKSAVQVATLDLAGRIAGLPLHRFFGGKLRDKIDLTFALSIDEPVRMAEAARAFPTVKCFKVKVAGDPAIDAARVHAVAKARPDADLWIDANQSYRPVHLESFLQRIAGMEQAAALPGATLGPECIGTRLEAWKRARKAAAPCSGRRG